MGFLALGAVLAVAWSAARAGTGAAASQVVATVGGHKITQDELEQRVRGQLASLQVQIYEIKKQALQSIADDYLLKQAASKKKLSVADYLNSHAHDTKVTEAEAKRYFDEHKDLQARFKYDDIKDRLMQALQRNREARERDALLEKLRQSEPLKVMLAPPRLEVASAGHPERGPANAPVTVVEFSDFQCPFCKRAEASLKEVREKYGDRVKLVYMDFPLGMHAHAIDAALAARCAGDQGKFWPYHDSLFAEQSKLAPDDLKARAKQLGLDTNKFTDCFSSGKYRRAVRGDVEQGEQVGVDSTPTFFINGRPLAGAQPFSEFKTVIDDELSRLHTKQSARADRGS